MISDDIVAGPPLVDAGDEEAGEEEAEIDTSLDLQVVLHQDADGAFEDLPEADGEEDQDETEDRATDGAQDGAYDVAEEDEDGEAACDGAQVDSDRFNVRILTLGLGGVLDESVPQAPHGEDQPEGEEHANKVAAVDLLLLAEVEGARKS